MENPYASKNYKCKIVSFCDKTSNDHLHFLGACNDINYFDSASGVRSRQVRVGLTLSWVFFLQVNLDISLTGVQHTVCLEAFFHSAC
jgi:hypothetical protein